MVRMFGHHVDRKVQLPWLGLNVECVKIKLEQCTSINLFEIESATREYFRSL